MVVLKFGTVGGGGGDGKNLLERGRGKQELGVWIWNEEINGFTSTFFLFYIICNIYISYSIFFS